MKTNEASALISTFRDLVQALDETQQSMLLAATSLERDGLLQICNALILDDTQKEKKEQLLRTAIKNIQVAQMIRALREAFTKSFDYVEPKVYNEYDD